MPINNFSVTRQSWEAHFDSQQMRHCKIYNTPFTTGQALDCNQGKGSIVFHPTNTYDVPPHISDPNFKVDIEFGGTCGIVSCVNLLRLAGRTETSEQEILEYAWEHDLCDGDNIRFEDDKPLYERDNFGGTTPDTRRIILDRFGIPSQTVPVASDRDQAILDIAEYVSAGRGVILSVHAYVLWGKMEKAYVTTKDYHAITVTSVQKDYADNITGFYICDSGSHQNDYARFCSADLIKRSLTGAHMNVTCTVIR